jgi:uncharacterized protein
MLETVMTNRSVEVDAVRAIALFGICVVNIPFLGQPLNVLITPPAAPIDRAAALCVELLFQGKFFVIFSFLFGWTFGAQLASAAAAGRSPGVTHARRIAGLALFGVLNAVFAFYGDILCLYAVLGALLYLVRRWTPRALLQLAAAFVALAFVSLLVIAASFADPAFQPGFSVGPSGYLGGVTDGIRQRVADWRIAAEFIVVFNGPLAAAAFAAGLAANKVGLFDRDSPAYARVLRVLPWLIIPAMLGNGLYAAAVGGWLGQTVWAAFGFAALAFGGPALSALYVAGIVTAVRAGLIGMHATTLGRMSLTAYIGESVFAGFVFNGYGLGLFGQVGYAGLVGVAVLVFAVVHMVGALWLRVFAMGPLERALQFITHGR